MMQKSNIEWCTHSHNTMTGCFHGCPYCYARKIAERFKGSKAWPVGFNPVFHADRLNDAAQLKKPAIIFEGSMTDVFGDWWEKSQIDKILTQCSQAFWHDFVILTKNPKRMKEVLIEWGGNPAALRNVYFGTSVTGVKTREEANRLAYLNLVHLRGYNTVISFEPLLHDPAGLIAAAGGISWADWIIIGGQTGPTKIPEKNWLCLIQHAAEGKPVFIKNNAGWPSEVKEFPPDLLPIAQAWGKAQERRKMSYDVSNHYGKPFREMLEELKKQKDVIKV